MIESRVVATPFWRENMIVDCFILGKLLACHFKSRPLRRERRRRTSIDTNPPTGARLFAFKNASKAPVGPNMVFQYTGSLSVYEMDQNESCYMPFPPISRPTSLRVVAKLTCVSRTRPAPVSLKNDQ